MSDRNESRANQIIRAIVILALCVAMVLAALDNSLEWVAVAGFLALLTK